MSSLVYPSITPKWVRVLLPDYPVIEHRFLAGNSSTYLIASHASGTLLELNYSGPPQDFASIYDFWTKSKGIARSFLIPTEVVQLDPLVARILGRDVGRLLAWKFDSKPEASGVYSEWYEFTVVLRAVLEP